MSRMNMDWAAVGLIRVHPCDPWFSVVNGPLVLRDSEANRVAALNDPLGGLLGDEGGRDGLCAAASAVAENLNHAGRQVRQRLSPDGDAAAGDRKPQHKVRPPRCR